MKYQEINNKEKVKETKHTMKNRSKKSTKIEAGRRLDFKWKMSWGPVSED